MTSLLSTFRPIDDRVGAVRVEDVYDTDADDLWSAITEPDRLARWIAEIAGELRVGGEFRIRFTSTYEGPGRVDACDRPHRLQVTIHPGTEDETVIEAVLTAEGERTRLVVEDRGIPLPVLADHGAGWQVHLEDLGDYLASREVRAWKPRWIALLPVYRDDPTARALVDQ